MKTKHANEVEDKIMSKIQGLMNMTVENGCSVEEAATALAILQELLTKYGLEMSQVIKDKGEEKRTDRVGQGERKDYGVKSKGRSQSWISYISYGVGKLCYVRSYTYKGEVYFLGDKFDVAVAEATMLWLIDQAHQRAKYVWKNRIEFGVDHLSYLPFENGFLAGFGSGVYEKILEMVHARAKEPQVAGLVVDKDVLIEEWFREKYPHMYNKVETVEKVEEKPKRKRNYVPKPRRPKVDRRKGHDQSAFWIGVDQGKETQVYKSEEIN